ncbi:MAG: hypothetical protein PHX04_01205 [Bacilli bacterium]|nr:hypothetical protein [Bacilli bacterium]
MIIIKSKKTLIIYKNSGKFYNVYDEDAFIINILFNYKVFKNQAGFPDTAISKIKGRLENEKISYSIIYRDKDIESKNFKFNNYQKFYEAATKKMDLNEKLSLINKKLESSSLEKLENLINIINDNL